MGIVLVATVAVVFYSSCFTAANAACLKTAEKGR